MTDIQAQEILSAAAEHLAGAAERRAEAQMFLIESIQRNGWADTQSIGQVMHAQECEKVARTIETVLSAMRDAAPIEQADAVEAVVRMNLRAALGYGRSTSVLHDHAGNLALDAWSRLAVAIKILA